MQSRNSALEENAVVFFSAGVLVDDLDELPTDAAPLEPLTQGLDVRFRRRGLDLSRRPERLDERVKARLGPLEQRLI